MLDCGGNSNYLWPAPAFTGVYLLATLAPGSYSPISIDRAPTDRFVDELQEVHMASNSAYPVTEQVKFGPDALESEPVRASLNHPVPLEITHDFAGEGVHAVCIVAVGVDHDVARVDLRWAGGGGRHARGGRHWA